ncbi:MAG: AmmeMemoRadiSam system protein B [Chloroflexi bacterium]|nr:AmmeMemoRadiSam system protein B [Chloroflexota bacterium]
MTQETRPRVRPLRITPYTHQGVPGFVLQDPLGLSDKMLFVPADLGPVLALLDGTRDLQRVRSEFLMRYGKPLPPEVLQALVRDLDAAFMLDNARFEEFKQARLDAYRRGPYRPPRLAGQVYPAGAEELRAALDKYLAAAPNTMPRPTRPIVGVVSPHIDYPRGWRVYARTWAYAQEAVRAAERVIVLGTDHNGPPGSLTLTRQNYATPYGVLPTATAAVDALAAAWGPEDAFRYELHHIGEHSVELALVWLHHLRGGKPVEVVPVLVGSFDHYVQRRQDPATDPRLNAWLEALAAVAAEKPTLVVAAVDFAHVGPAFGDPRPYRDADKQRLRRADEALLNALRVGDPEAWFWRIAGVDDRDRICGFAALYLYLRLLEGHTGVVTGYEHCPADQEGGSLVSIAGAVTLAR